MAHQLELTVKTSADTQGLNKIQAGLRGLSDQALKSQIAVETASGKLDRLQTAATRSGTALSAMRVEQAERNLTALQKSAAAAEGGLTGLAARAGPALASLGSKIEALAKAGAIAGFSALGAGIAYSVKEAADSQKVYAQLDAVLKSTGGAAGVTAKEVTDFALAAQKVTPFTDEAVASVSNLLLTFTNIGKPIFNDATQAVLDMSTALGEDAPKAAIQLGKALQDPVLGMTALRRVGVAFDADQQQLIKTLVQTGDRLGAQKIILAELTKEFGGSAAAAGKTFAGQLQIARNSLQEVAETIGAAILPSITELSKEFTAFLQDHDEEIKAFASVLAKDLPDAIETTRAGVVAAGEGAEVLARGLGDVTGGINSLKVEAAALAAALAFLFPEGALVAGIAAVLISIGLMAQDTEKASSSALTFKVAWLNAAADIIDAIAGINEAIASGIVKKGLQALGGAFGLALGGFGGAEEGMKRAGDAADALNSKLIADQSIFRSESEKLRSQANEATSTVKQMSQAEQDLINQDYGTRHAADWKKADSALLGARASALGLSAAQQDIAASGLDSLTVIANLTTQTGALKSGYDLVAGAAKAFTEMLAPRTLAQISLDRQIAEAEALMATYSQAGKEIPKDLQKWHDALLANKDVADKVAKAATANFEELAAKLDQAGKDGGNAIKQIVEALDGLPEQTIVEVATKLNRSSLDEVEKMLKFLAETHITIPVILQLNALGVIAAIESLPSILRGPLEGIIKKVTQGATGIIPGQGTLTLPPGMGGVNPNTPNATTGGASGGLSTAEKAAQQGLTDLAVAFEEFHKATGGTEQDFLSLIKVMTDTADLDKRVADATIGLNASMIEHADKAYQLKEVYVELATQAAKTGETIEQAMAEMFAGMVDKAQSAINSILNAPTREGTELQLRLDKLQLERDSISANNPRAKALDAEIASIQRLIKVRQDSLAILRDQAILANKMLQTDAQQINAVTWLNNAMLNLTQTVAGLDGRLQLVTGASGGSAVPQAASGGYVAQSGLAVIHRGEWVTPASQRQTPTTTINFTSYITADSNASEESMRKLAKMVREEAEAALRKAAFRGSYVTSGAYTPS